MEIELTSKALRQRDRLKRAPHLFERIEVALNTIAENPYDGKLLGGEWEGVRSYRVGEWRILYKVFEKKLLVLVLTIADRKEVYR